MTRHTIITLFALLLLPFCGMQAQEAHHDILRLDEAKALADSAYAQSDYQMAATFYENILQGGVASHEVYYNLGCAYFRLNRLGDAIVAFERALRLKPNDSDTRENLAICYNRTTDHIDQLPEPLLVSWWHSLCSAFSLTAWYVVVAVLALLLAAVVVWFALSRQLRWRRFSLFGIIIFVVFLSVSAACTISVAKQLNVSNSAIVVVPISSIKVSPTSNSGEKFTLHEGTKVRIEECNENWYRIRIADGNSGWVATSAVEVI